MSEITRMLEEHIERELRKAYAKGYAKALDEINSFLSEKLDRRTGMPEAELEPRESLAKVRIPPRLERAVRYVQGHPGTTARQAAEELGDRNVLYTVHKRGLVGRQGSKFFPLNAEVFTPEI